MVELGHKALVELVELVQLPQVLLVLLPQPIPEQVEAEVELVALLMVLVVMVALAIFTLSGWTEMIITSAIGIGDLLYLKAAIDHSQKQFQIYPATGLIKWSQRNADYANFINQLCELLFPGQIVNDGPEFKSMMEVYSDHNLQCVKPELANLLPQGQPLEDDYIVMTTKVRYLPKQSLKLDELLQTIGDRKVIILGEREVEMNSEYANDNRNGPTVYSIYTDLLKLPNIIDRTIPALGITSPNINQYRQDALIMRDAKFTITLGIGGNFTTAISVGKTIGFKTDHEFYSENIFANQVYPNNSVTWNWKEFIERVKHG